MDEVVLQNLKVLESIYRMVLKDLVDNEEEICKLKDDVKVVKAQLRRLMDNHASRISSSEPPNNSLNSQKVW